MSNKTVNAFSLGDNFYDYYTGVVLGEFQGYFYFNGKKESLMKTWIENGDRAFSAI